MVTATDMGYLQQAIELAAEALSAGDQPFGSILVSQHGELLAAERNRVNTEGDATQHPELALARWATEHLTADQRAKAIVYTSGEHCPMCAAAHGWVGLGKVIYVASAAQLTQWLAEFGVAASPINFVPIQQLVPNIEVQGPVPELVSQVYQLHRSCWSRS